MNGKLKTILAIAFAIIMTFSFVACGSSDAGSSDTSQNSTRATQAKTQSTKTKAEDGVVKVDVPTKDFIATWTADSAKAEYLYGNLTITLNDDNTWTGVVTDENLHGTWEETDFGVHLYDVVEEWECDLYYTDKDNFVLSEDGLKVVLTRQ